MINIAEEQNRKSQIGDQNIPSPHYKKIAQAIEDIVNSARPEQASDLPLYTQTYLENLAQKAGYSPAHFQKMFTQYTGISPTQMKNFLKLRTAQDFLLQGHNTLEAAHAAGLSGNARLHENCVTIDALTPAEYANRTTALRIEYGRIETAFGLLWLGISKHGLCWAGFEINGSADKNLAAMQKFWKTADFSQASRTTLAPYEEQITTLAAHLSGKSNIIAGDKTAPEMRNRQPPTALSKNPIKLYIKGTNFQLKIWEALLKIPYGTVLNYETLGHHIKLEKAGRAIGNAVGANPISWLIPCHRVIRKSGMINHYAWGSDRKKILLGLEGQHNISDSNTPYTSP